jgi:hypothetical protein
MKERSRAGTAASEDAAYGTRMAPLEDCDALRAALAAQWTEAVLLARYGAGRGMGWEETDDVVDASEGGTGERAHSETNVQEPGVDEADMVKTDGTYLYVTPPDRSLAVVRAWPPEALSMAARVDLGAYGAQLLRDGPHLLALGTVDDAWPAWHPDTAWRGAGATRLRWLDVAEPALPRTTRVVDIEGWPIATRAVAGVAWTALSVPMVPPPTVWELVWADDLPSDGATPEAREAARAVLLPRVRALLDALPDEAMLPRTAQRTPTETPEEPLLQCSDLWAPDVPGTPGMVALVRASIATPHDALQATGLLSAATTGYATSEALTLAETSWPVLWDEAWDERAPTAYRPNTRLYRFVLGPEARYAGAAHLDGLLLTPWALDEHREHLRAVLTDPERGTSVQVLDTRPRDGTLPTVGALYGIAPGESMRAVRFAGDRAWLVTFEQVDPLFTLDLSDPRAPRIAGRLEVPGYSAYLHPISPVRLLGVGMAGKPDGRLTGVDLSTFDIQDAAAPVRLDELVVTEDGWSGSEALWDPRAFTYYDGVAAIPVHMEAVPREWGGSGEAFAGLVVVDVAEDGTLSELGRVDHADLSPEVFGGMLPQMRRSVVVEDTLYSVSDAGVKASDLRAPEVERGRVGFIER